MTTYATWNPADKDARITLSGGDLVATSDGTNNAQSVRGTQFKSSGKWYYELTVDAIGGVSNLPLFGLANAAFQLDTGVGGANPAWAYLRSGEKVSSGAPVAYGASYTTGDVISVLYDADGGTITFWKNGASQGTAFSGVSDSLAAMWLGYSTTSTVTVNFGASAFAYTPPGGYTGWALAPTNDGAVTFSPLLAFGGGPASGAVTFSPLFALGGGPPSGAVSLRALTAAGTGRALISTGALTLSALTAAATGQQLNWGAAALSAFIASGTGSPGNNITVSLVAPVPRLVATGESGNILTVVARAPVPVLVATAVNPAIITASLSAPAPRLVAAGLRGNIGTAALAAIAPTLAAAGYPAYIITGALTAPAARLVAALVNAPTANYRTWVINARKGAATEYTGWQFDSYARFNGRLYAVSAVGLVELDTSTADGSTAITGTVRTGAASFGTSMLKRVPRIYVGGQFNGDVTFRTITSEGGTREYLLPNNHVSGVQQRRVPVGKGPKSRYWQFELAFANDDEIDNIIVYPTVLRRRVQ